MLESDGPESTAEATKEVNTAAGAANDHAGAAQPRPGGRYAGAPALLSTAARRRVRPGRGVRLQGAAPRRPRAVVPGYSGADRTLRSAS